jgi:hypothetical protein
MAQCQNCGSHVSDDYARVFTPNGVDQPRCCPNCGKVREGNDVREARSGPENGTEPSKYDPAKDPTVDVATDGGEARGG